MTFTTEQSLLWCEMWSWRLWTIPVFLSMNYGFWPSFPKLSLMALILSQTGITEVSDGLDTSVFDVKYGAEEFELIFVFPSPWSTIFGPSFSKIAIMPQIPKKLRWLYQLSKASFNVNHGLGDFGLLFMCPSSDYQVSQIKFPWKLLFVFHSP